MTIGEMLVNQKTRDYLILSWSMKYTHNVAQIEKISGRILSQIPFLILLGVTIFWQIMIPFIVLIVLGVFMRSAVWSFKEDSHKLFLELGAEIKLSGLFVELKDHARRKLTEAAELSLWVQEHRPGNHDLIIKRQKRLKYLYDLFAKFQLSAGGYDPYYEQAKINSQVPEWFMKMESLITNNS